MDTGTYTDTVKNNHIIQCNYTCLYRVGVGYYIVNNMHGYDKKMRVD